MLRVIFFLTVILMTGCSAIDIKEYRDNTPTLDVYDYFSGHTTGWGIVQDRGGKLTRQFVVDIQGTVNDDGSLTLQEYFTWSDGEESERTWTLRKQGPHTYTGTAGDVIGEAEGTLYGNVLHWTYLLELKVDDSTWEITFDDWMYLVSDHLLLNKATMIKFGVKVGEITIVFKKN